jgi:hypothetical protein
MAGCCALVLALAPKARAARVIAALEIICRRDCACITSDRTVPSFIMLSLGLLLLLPVHGNMGINYVQDHILSEIEYGSAIRSAQQ